MRNSNKNYHQPVENGEDVIDLSILEALPNVQEHYSEASQQKINSAEKRFEILTKFNNKRRISIHEKQNECNKELLTLLYIVLVLNKVEQVKNKLQVENLDAYDEFKDLFDPLHSPNFHLEERKRQNIRVRKIYDRKLYFKTEYEALSKINYLKENDTTIRLKSDLTTQQLSETIAHLTDEMIILRKEASDKTKSEIEIKNMKHESNQKDEKICELERSLEASKKHQEETEQKFQMARDTIEKRNLKLVTLQAKNKAADDRLEFIEESMKKERTIREVDRESCLNKTESKLEATKECLSWIKEDLCNIKESLQASSDFEERKKASNTEIEYLKGKVLQYGSEINDLRRTKRNLDKRISELTSEQEKSMDSRAELHKRFTELISEHAMCKDSRVELDIAIRKIHELDSEKKCLEEKYMSELQLKDKVLEEYDRKNDVQKDEVNSLRRLLSESKANCSQLLKEATVLDSKNTSLNITKHLCFGDIDGDDQANLSHEIIENSRE